MIVLGVAVLTLQGVCMPVGMVYAETMASPEEASEQAEFSTMPSLLEASEEKDPRFFFQQSHLQGTVNEPINVTISSNQEVSEFMLNLPAGVSIVEDKQPTDIKFTNTEGNQWQVKTDSPQRTFSIPLVIEKAGEYKVTVGESKFILYTQASESQQINDQEDISSEEQEPPNTGEETVEREEIISNNEQSTTTDTSENYPKQVEEENLNRESKNSEYIVQNEVNENLIKNPEFSYTILNNQITLANWKMYSTGIFSQEEVFLNNSVSPVHSAYRRGSVNSNVGIMTNRTDYKIQMVYRNRSWLSIVQEIKVVPGRYYKVSGGKEGAAPSNVRIYSSNKETIFDTGNITSQKFEGFFTNNDENIFIELASGTSDNNIMYGEFNNIKLEAVKGQVRVRHIDTSGNILKEEEDIEGYVNDSYNVKPENFEDWNLVETIGNPEGIFGLDKKEVVFVYEKKIVNPVDPLEPETEVEPENRPDLPEAQGLLSIDFVSSFNFGSQAISVHDQTYYAQPQRLLNGDGTVNEIEERPNYVQISDRRSESERNGWELAVTQKEQFKGKENQVLNGASITLSNQQVVTAQGKTAPELQSVHSLIPGNRQTLIKAQGSEGMGTWIYRFGDAETAKESVALNVPKGANPEATSYSTKLTWELSAVPYN
ncbi:WxL domain-containing protein [Enterococcus sp. DIV1304_2]|uniref:WxL domain-containing protein n=1 Tax=unclassified Enterococcus TaxID=2608891 RepID=UPI003D2FB1B1